MFKAVAVENIEKKSRKNSPVWKRVTFWFKDYSSKHNRSMNNSVIYNARNKVSYDINTRIAAENPEIYSRHVLR